MSGFNGLVNRLNAKANTYIGKEVGDLLTEAATAVSVQAARIAGLEHELEKSNAISKTRNATIHDLEQEVNQLEFEINQLRATT